MNQSFFLHHTLLSQLLSGKSAELQQWLKDPSPQKIGLCLFIISLGCGLYGATVGCWRSPLMAGYVALKLPLLIFLTLLCNGFLNGLLGVLLGSGLSFRQSLLAQLMSFTILALILGALSPVTLFLAYNAPSPDAVNARLAHSFTLLVHTALIAFTGTMANLHLFRTLKVVCPDRRTALITLFSWLSGNAFVGAQFSWILRPFFGSPNLEVAFLRPDPMNGTFYGAVFRSLETLTGNFPTHAMALWTLSFGILALAFLLKLSRPPAPQNNSPKTNHELR